MKKVLSLFLSLCMVFSIFAVSSTSYASDDGYILAGIDGYRVTNVDMSPAQTLTIDVYAMTTDVSINVSNTKVVNNCTWVPDSEWTESTISGYYCRPILVYANATGTSKITLNLNNIDGKVIDTEVVTVNCIKASITLSSSFTMDSAKSKTLKISPKYTGGIGDGYILRVETTNKKIVNPTAVNSDGTAVLTATGHGKVTMCVKYIDAGTNLPIVSKNFTVDVHKGKTVSKSATYFADGYKNRRICSVCNKVLSKGTTVKKLKLKTPTVKVTAGKKKITVKYTKVKDATGFQVKYTKGNKSYTKKFKTAKSATKSITKLKKGKYKVQVRAYKTSGKKTVYSSYSKAKTVTVK